ncbi:glycosyltransferase family 4 protein [Streptomyces sp. SID11726]|nr:glycosyltransferase family 4 protein [Streptomyces sp. SID11726]
MVRALEDAGHHCVIYLYEPGGTQAAFHEKTIRSAWPWIRADVSDTETSMHICDAIIATSWQSAHVLGSRSCEIETRRMYFIQDYEPYFVPRGSQYSLAESTYRLGFHNIALGPMVREHVKSCGPHSMVDFSCDTEVYKLKNRGTRKGVVCYARLDTPRRGTELAALALSIFHRAHPDQPIHVFGDTFPEASFPFTHHGRMPPADLADLYNSCIAGLALSFTNISLIVEEMLACGAIPVANDYAPNRPIVPSGSIKWADATPRALADALSSAVSTTGPEGAEQAAKSVRTDNWATTQSEFVRIVQAEVYGRARAESR